MFALLLCVQALDSSRFLVRHHDHPLHAAADLTEPQDETVTAAKPVAWNSYVSDYCGSFCNMTGVDPGHCTLCAQRMNFTVEEGKVSCAVECQGVQTDRVTDEAVNCSARLDACMFVDVDAGACKLECAVASGAARKDCGAECVAFKVAQREKGTLFSTFLGPNEVETTVEKEVNGTNGTTEMVNVTVLKVEGVEPLPTAGPGARNEPVTAEFRFHVNESQWRAEPQAYCGSFYCNAEAVGVAGVDPYHCVECVNRLNNSVEAGLGKCRVGCDMKETDAIGEEQFCGDDCMHSQFDLGTCFLECALPMHKDVSHAECVQTCRTVKAEHRAAGSEVRPYGWPEPPANSTNGTNATEE